MKKDKPGNKPEVPEASVQERANLMIDQAEEAIRKGSLDKAVGIYKEVLSTYKRLNKEGASEKIIALYDRLKRLYARLAS